MLIIRFARIGRKKQAFFKLVVAEKARAVQKKSVAELGYYNPHTDAGKGEFVYDKEKVLQYIKNGAQMSQTVARKLVQEGLKEAGKFVIARPTKPKKEEKKPEEKVPEETLADVAESSDSAAEDSKEEPTVVGENKEKPEEAPASEEETKKEESEAPADTEEKKE